MRHILVVENDRPIAALLKTFLRREAGYRTSQAHDGEAALAALNRNLRPDAAIVDLLMPGVSGLAIARAATERSVPVLLMSGAIEQMDQLSELDCPYLLKPFRLADLEQQVRTLIDRPEETLARVRSALDVMSGPCDALPTVPGAV